MNDDSDGQGESWGQRAKRSRMANPVRRPGEPTKAVAPGRTGSASPANEGSRKPSRIGRIISLILSRLADRRP